MRAGRWKGEKKSLEHSTKKKIDMHRENLLHYGSQYRACSPTVQTYISEKKKWIGLIRDVDTEFISVLYCTYVPDLQRPNLPILGTYLPTRVFRTQLGAIRTKASPP